MSSQDSIEKKFKLVRNFDIPLGTDMSAIFPTGTKISIRFLGYEVDDFLLFKFPLVSNVASYLAPDISMSAAFQHDGHNVLFKSSVKYALPKQRFAFLAYPDNFRVYEVRKTERVNCLLPTSIELDKKYYGVLEDISTTGSRLTFDSVYQTSLRDLESGRLLEINIITPKDNLTIQTTIMSVRKSFTRVTLGLKFNDDSKQGQKILSKFIDSIKFTGINKEERA